MTVGIEQRDDDHDDVLENVQRAGIVRRREREEQLVGRLRRADFRRVNARADRHDRLLRRSQAFGLVRRQRARIGQSLIGGANRLEIPDVLRRADDRGEACDDPPSTIRDRRFEPGPTERRRARSTVRCLQRRRAVGPRPCESRIDPGATGSAARSGSDRPCTDGERDGGDPRELHSPDDIKGRVFQPRYRGAEMRRGVVPELDHQGMTIERGLDDPALHAASPPCTSRTSSRPAAAAAVTYSSTTEGISRGANE